jgi:DnaK suppressor protein
LASEKNLAQLLKNINLALNKIKKGNFGVCEICGQEIEKDRLIAYPEAAECQKHLKKKSG